MRLLLDEMYPRAIAEQLRGRGHDVSALTERPELRSLSDPDVFKVAQEEKRAVVSENIADFVMFANNADERGQGHYGLVLIDPVKFPRGQKRTVGRLVSELDRLLNGHTLDEATGSRHWL